ncbi:MAG: LamG-like jellyroll fold domain-containing protein, partial [Planctomycetota bacterium]
MRTKELICFTWFVLVLGLVGSTRGDPVPPPWVSADIGSPLPGSADWDPYTGLLTVSGNGNDIWDEADNFHYVYREWTGDIDLICRVVSFPDGPDGWQKAGLMVRQDIMPFSPFVDMVMTGIYGGGANFQWRDHPHELCGRDIDADNVTEPYWVRLTRTGNTFASYLSPDGFNWTQLGSNHDTIMFDPVLIGYCVTSHEPGFLVTATFEIYDDICLAIGCPPPHPDPPNGAIDVPVDANLSWRRGQGTVQDEVYFGTNPYALPLVATIMNLPPFPPLYEPPGDLVASTTYYWQIVEVNGLDRYEGNIWNFTTIRGEAQCDYPADGAIITGDNAGANIWTKLMFIPGPTAVSHVGYFHEDYSKVESRNPCAYLGPPPYATTPGWEYTLFAGNPSVPPANYTLERGKRYYWTVDANDALNNEFYGDIWEFVIQGYKAFSPDPPNEAVFISWDPVDLLSWLPGFGVEYHDIYMGTSWEDVNNAVYDPYNPPPEFVATRHDPNYQIYDLADGTKYYWRVDEVNGRLIPIPPYGTYHKGDVWCFEILPHIHSDHNLVAWWKFDFGVGIMAYDWSGHDNHGILMGDPQWVASMNTMLGVAMDFDGSGDYIYTGESASDLRIGGNHPRTVAAWVYTRAFNNGAIWDVGAHSDSQDFCLRTLDTDNQWRVQYGGGVNHDFTYDSLNKWVHFMLVFEPPSSSILFVNGVVMSTINDATLNTSNANPFQIGCHGWQNDYFNGIIDDVRIYDYAWDPPIYIGPPPYAWDPSPYNGQVSVPVSVTLKWEPGKYAAQHDVYLGTDKASVINATTSSTGIYQGRIGPNTLPVSLDAAELYYWRVDEVNLAGPHPYVWKGSTWMFRTEGAAGGLLGLYYHWDGQLPNDPLGPDNAFQIFVMGRIDPKVYFDWGAGFGIPERPKSPDPNVNDDDFGCRWIGHVECPVDANYTFYTTTDEGARLFIDGVQILPDEAWQQQEMIEWSCSVMLTAGMHDIEMHHYEHLGGAGARLQWSAIPTNPMDYAIYKQIIPPIWLWPPLLASGPRPTDGATINDWKPALEWIPGFYAATHELYFSSNFDDVNNRNPGIKEILSDPCRPFPAVPRLELGKTYYWCVDEVNSASERWDARTVWSFTISECLSIDNMEDYNDRRDIRRVWKDGYTDVVWGCTPPKYCVQVCGSSGSNLNVATAVGSPVQGATGPIPPTPLNFQAMVLRYDNDGFANVWNGVIPWNVEYCAAYFSEIEASTTGPNSLDVGQTWDSEGIKSLSLSFQGHPLSDGDYDASAWPAYTIFGRGRDIGGRHDEFYYLSQYPFIGNGSVQAQVYSMDNTDPWAKAGVMIREKWTPYSKFAAVFMTPGQGVTFQWRDVEDGPTTSITKPNVSVPEYVRLL